MLGAAGPSAAKVDAGSAATRGTVLRTEDGGATWAAIPRPHPPATRRREVFRRQPRHRVRRSYVVRSLGCVRYARLRQDLASARGRSIGPVARRRFSRSRYRRARRPRGQRCHVSAQQAGSFATRQRIVAIAARHATNSANRRLGRRRRRTRAHHQRPRPQLADAGDRSARCGRR